MTKIYTVRLKADLPAAVAGNRFTSEEIKAAWRGKSVEPYGEVIGGYGDEYPWNVRHIAVRLDIPGTAAFTVIVMDELADSIDWSKVPSKPSYGGLIGCVASLDSLGEYN